jgi:putative DNA primase/helicase
VPTYSGKHFNAVATPSARKYLDWFWSDPIGFDRDKKVIKGAGNFAYKEHAGKKELFFQANALVNGTLFEGEKDILVVEGEFDAMSIFQVTGGKIPVVAILGKDQWYNTAATMLTKELKGKRFVFMLDADAQNDGGKDKAQELCDKLEFMFVPAWKFYLIQALDDEDKNRPDKRYQKVDANDFLCGFKVEDKNFNVIREYDAEYLKINLEDVFDCAHNVLDAREAALADEKAAQGKETDLNLPIGSSKRRQSEPARTSSDFVVDDDYDLFRANIMLNVIDPARLTGGQWLAVNSCCKNLGIPDDVVDAFNRRDMSRYNDRENRSRINSLRDTSYDIRVLHGIAKIFGYKERDVRRQWYQLHPELRLMPVVLSETVDLSESPTPAQIADAKKQCIKMYEKIFDGLPKIKVSAGSILSFADADAAPALKSLFVSMNFDEFIRDIKDDNNNDTTSLVYDCSDIFTPITDDRIKSALAWLVKKIYPFFNADEDALMKFVVDTLERANANDRLKDRNAQKALMIIGDSAFANEILKQSRASGKNIRFDDDLRRELREFAEHSVEMLESLIRFDYRRVDKFLSQRCFTDVSCGELLVDVQGEFMRYDTQQDTWYVWSKNHWQAVNGKSQSRLYSLWTPLARKARVIAQFLATRRACDAIDRHIEQNFVESAKKNKMAEFDKMFRAETSAKSLDKKANAAYALESSKSIEHFLSQASGLPEIQIETSDLDAKKYLFNAANCTIDLVTMKTYPARQSDLLTLASPTIYDPAATSDVWENFIRSAVPDDALRNWLQRFFGYCLSGSVDEDIFVFIYGVGGGGKTTFLNAISATIGDYARVFNVDAITENYKQTNGDEPTPALASLRNCRLAVTSETKQNRRLDAAKVKLWTGGGKLSACEKYKSPFEFTAKFKVVVDGNFTLRCNDITDRGIKRRLRIVPFNHPPAVVDTQLETKLKTAENRSAILNWLLDGWKEYCLQGLGNVDDPETLPVAMNTALDDYYTGNDFIGDFLTDRNFEVGNQDDNRYRVKATEVWQTYNAWRRITPCAPAFLRKDFVRAMLLNPALQDRVVVKQIEHTDCFVGLRLDLDTAESNFEN